jgi:S1-C subfamily serine protease
MDTAGDSVSLTQQQPAGFAIPVNTALSVASQIAAGHASPAITIGYPPFLDIFTGPGTSSDPQAQAQQQQQNELGGGTAPACYTSSSSLKLPPAIAPASSGTLVDGTICGTPAAAAGITGGSVITAVNRQPVHYRVGELGAGRSSALRQAHECSASPGHRRPAGHVLTDMQLPGATHPRLPGEPGTRPFGRRGTWSCQWSQPAL